MILGTNEIGYCDAALWIEDEEVFRVREDEHGQLLVDCDIRNDQGERIAKIVKNTPVYVAEGYRAKVKPGEPSEVIHEATGRVVARIARLGPRKISVTGTFWVKGSFVAATDSGLYTGGATLRANSIMGFGTAVRLERGSLSIGFMSPPR
jgi:hypothetical protein